MPAIVQVTESFCVTCTRREGILHLRGMELDEASETANKRGRCHVVRVSSSRGPGLLLRQIAGYDPGVMLASNPENLPFLAPVLVLVVWTLVMAGWLLATRIPAMKKARIHPDTTRHRGREIHLPSSVRAVADNYNHLHEQPLVFYVLMFFTVFTDGANAVSMYLAWAYVISRMVHSLIQVRSPKVMHRFFAFLISTLWLGILVLRELFRVVGALGAA